MIIDTILQFMLKSRRFIKKLSELPDLNQ